MIFQPFFFKDPHHTTLSEVQTVHACYGQQQQLDVEFILTNERVFISNLLTMFRKIITMLS